ncbi:MAG: molybdopterin-binding/glycosyltransferase family 2 protein [Sneathiellales bacterium]|nr:molybdopterin-binding/glycosyltransferase family 2 protein [Sneathiellales bacterium]
MIFDRLPLEDAEGAILAHAVDAGPLGLLKKGHILDQSSLAAIRGTGETTILAAKLEESDVGENTAADQIARLSLGPNVAKSDAFTGRSNLIAETSGLLRINRQALLDLNRIDPSITLATLKDLEKVDKGQMVATIKIIPFATEKANLAKAALLTEEAKKPIVELVPFKRQKIGVISTKLPGTAEKLIAKSEKVLEQRLLACGNRIDFRLECAHHEDHVARAISALRDKECDLILIFGASAITDPRDIIPRGLEQADGKMEHFGMPVDPGNLLMLGTSGTSTVVGLPGCTRSPKLNGFDWVLQRLLCQIPVTGSDIMAMGEGGLLKEITSRPQPRHQKSREGDMEKPKIAVLLLAAGQSRRMGPQNKLLALVDGKPMLRHVAEAISKSDADHTLMITGHDADNVLKTIWDLDIASAQNPDYAEGISTSVKLGFKILSSDYDGILVCLGDMPFVTSDILNKMIAAFDPVEKRAIIAPVLNGKRGNPVLISTDLNDDIQSISGDIGAKALIAENEDLVHTIEFDSTSIFTDIDTPQSLEQVTGQNAAGKE